MFAVILANAVPTPGQNSPAKTPRHQTSSAKTPRDPDKPETPHLEFVTEYLRELAAMEDIRLKGQKEFETAGTDNGAKFRSIIYTNTLVQLELQSQIAMMNAMNLRAPYDTIIDSIAEFYADKMETWKEMSEIATLFLDAEPKPGVDYSKAAAELPKLRARLDYLDQTIFQASPLVFSTLVDTNKTNKQGSVDRLNITKAERKRLIETINTEFGPGIDSKGSDYLVSAASVVKSYLEKDDYKSSDDPPN